MTSQEKRPDTYTHTHTLIHAGSGTGGLDNGFWGRHIVEEGHNVTYTLLKERLATVIVHTYLHILQFHADIYLFNSWTITVANEQCGCNKTGNPCRIFLEYLSSQKFASKNFGLSIFEEERFGRKIWTLLGDDKIYGYHRYKNHICPSKISILSALNDKDVGGISSHSIVWNT